MNEFYISEQKAKERMDRFGKERRPFLCILSFDLKKNIVLPLEEVNPDLIKFRIQPMKALTNNKPRHARVQIEANLLPFRVYKEALDYVKEQINLGNSFLTNLTVATPIKINASLEEIYTMARAKYKLWLKDHFVCFSPELFVTVNQSGQIASFPMKGTIDAAVPNAHNVLLNDPKECHEHATIVDLIRNDLSQICHKVWVERYRYIDKIEKADGSAILQVSSEICGKLPDNWQDNIGTWLTKLLPAGSISGAPKEKTIEIIKEAETKTYENNRGFYTGVFGVYDGSTFTSGVMIRFIEQTANGLVFKSGGGITHLSQANKEYEELKQKIYVPVF